MKNRIKTELIERYMQENKISKTEFCKRCKISLCVYYKIMRQERNLKLRTILKISNFLNVEIWEMFGY